MIFRTDIAGHLEQGVKVGFLAGTKLYTPKRAAFTREVPSTGAFEIYADMGATPWPRQNGGNSGAATDSRTGLPAAGGLHAGGPVTVVGGNERGIIVYNLGWDVVIGIEHDAINDDRLGDLDIWARTAGMRFEQHKDQQCFDVLAAGTGTTHGNGYDGKPLFSGSHADPGAEYTTAQSNSLSTTLTLDNYEAAKVAAAKFLDDRGQPVSYNHNLLIHPPDLTRTAAQITDNREDYATANRAANPYAGTSSRLEVPGTWFASAQWVIVDPTQPIKPVILQVRQDAQPAMWDDLSQGSGIRYYRFYARYNAVPGPWRLALQGHA